MVSATRIQKLSHLIKIAAHTEPRMSAQSWEELKAQGNSAYAGGNYKEAIDAYTNALKSTDIDGNNRALVLSNRAQCYIRLEQFENAIEDCTACLTLSSNNIKALFRRFNKCFHYSCFLIRDRATSFEKCGRKEEAIADYKKLLELKPKLADAQAGLQR